jgi:hypothetical protein
MSVESDFLRFIMASIAVVVRAMSVYQTAMVIANHNCGDSPETVKFRP